MTRAQTDIQMLRGAGSQRPLVCAGAGEAAGGQPPSHDGGGAKPRPPEPPDFQLRRDDSAEGDAPGHGPRDEALPGADARKRKQAA